jgi:hypothetical protein
MELLYGYFNIATGEIILASPRINPTIERELKPVFEELTHRTGVQRLIISQRYLFF